MMKARQDHVRANLCNGSFSRIRFPRRAPSRMTPMESGRPPGRNPGTGVGGSVHTGLDSRLRGDGTFIAATAALALMLALLAACASPAPTPTPTVTPVPVVASPSVPAVPTWSQSAEGGKTIFTDRCAKCHGDQGQGGFAPSVMGPSAHLEKFSTVQGLLDFVSLAMPQDAPGSLSKEGYQEVLAFLLVQNRLVPTQATLEPEHFTHTPLTAQ